MCMNVAPLTTAGMKRIGTSEVYYDGDSSLYYHSPRGRKPHLMYARGGGWFSCSREGCSQIRIDPTSYNNKRLPCVAAP